MSDVRGPHVAHLEREAEAGASPPSLSASPGARVPGAPAGGIFTSASPLKRESTLGDLSRCVKWCINPPIKGAVFEFDRVRARSARAAQQLAPEDPRELSHL